MANVIPNQQSGIDSLMSFLSLLSENGEAKIEVSFRIKGADEDSDKERPKPKRPYDPEGRIAGIRGIAQHLGLGIASVQNMIRDGMIPVYRIGKKKLYAYDDEIVERIASFGDNLNSAAKDLMKRRGYRKETVYKAVSNQ